MQFRPVDHGGHPDHLLRSGQVGDQQRPSEPVPQSPADGLRIVPVDGLHIVSADVLSQSQRVERAKPVGHDHDPGARFPQLGGPFEQCHLVACAM